MKKVLFMGKAAFESRCKAIESAIIGQQLIRRLEAAKKMEDEEEAEMEKADVATHMARRTKVVEAYKKLFIDVARDWKDERHHIIGHVQGMSICLHLSVLAMATKALPMIGPLLKFISL